MKWLYAHTYYTENEFWEMFDRPWYDGLRRTCHAGSLPSVWDKVKMDPNDQTPAVDISWGTWALQFWPLGGLWGIWKATESGEYLIARNSTWKARDGLGQSG